MGEKAYLLTFHNALNYGAVLQCVALYKAISSIVECQVIDYRSPVIEKRYKVFRKEASAKDVLKSILLLHKTREKRKLFNRFLANNTSLTSRYDCYHDLCSASWKDSDVFIVGSDQVWNFDITHNDPTFCLKFTPEDAKCISYAASIGKKLMIEPHK